MSNAEIVFGVVTLGLTLAGGYIALRLKPLEDADRALSDRLVALHDDMKEEREKFERRLSDVERSYLTRAEMTAAIKEIRDDFNRGVERVEQVVYALGSKFDKLAERVGNVEGAS
jgi:hypothetical protein